MHKRLVTRYAMRSPEDADENQRRVEGVFAELAANEPGNVSYIVLRLADDSFLHVSFHDHGDDEVNPIASTASSCSAYVPGTSRWLSSPTTSGRCWTRSPPRATFSTCEPRQMPSTGMSRSRAARSSVSSASSRSGNGRSVSGCASWP